MVISSWVRPVKMDMLLIMHQKFSLFKEIGSFCFLHFRQETWMYDTFRFLPGFHYFQSLHFICWFVFLHTSAACECESECVPARVYECVCKRVCICVYVCAQDCRFSTFYFLFRFHYHSAVLYQRPCSFCHHVFKTAIISPPLAVVFAMIYIFT